MTDPVSHLTDLDGASVSVLARDENGEILAEHDPDRALAPASNTKLITSALALDALGPDHRFETRAEGYGAVDGDRLAGDLALVGSGQPDFSRADLDELARSVAEEVREVGGDLLLDGSRFGDDQLGPGWTWGDERYYYGARSSALALDGNLVTVEITGDESGDFAVGVAPDTELVAVEVDLEVAADGLESDGDTESDDGSESGDDLRVFADHETGVVRVEGSLPAGTDRTEQVPVADPERHCGAAFRDALADAGVAVEGDLRVAGVPLDRDSEPELSTRVQSAPVSTLIREMNVPSDNFVAEQLARAVAGVRTGDRASEADTESESGSWERWEAVATEFLEARGVGACRIRDGSGLSRYNVVPARGMVKLLEWAREQSWSDHFFDSLPAPGEGTLETRLDDVPGLRAKTGTITGTSALSGLLHREDGSDVAFSVIFGGLTVEADEARERQDAFIRAL